MRHAWNDFLNAPELADLWGRKVNDETAAAFDLDGFIRNKVHYPKSQRHHAACHQAISLPVVAAPSPGIRMARQTADGTTVHQLLEVNMGTYCGIAMNEGKIDWKQSLIRPELVGKRGTPSNFRLSARENGQAMLKFTEWRQLVKNRVFTLWMSPSTDTRRRIRIETSFANFCAWLQAEGVKASESPLQLEYAYAVKGVKLPDFFPVNDPMILNKVKDKITLERCGETVVFSYTTQNVTNAMNVAFETAPAA